MAKTQLHFTCQHKTKLYPDGCTTCHLLNRKPRQAITLSAALAFAEKKVAEGMQVHVYDAETAAVIVLSKYNKPEQFRVDASARPVYALAVR